MRRRDDADALGHMLEHAREAVAMVRGRTRADLDADRLFNLALVRLVEIVGEAAKRVSLARQAAIPGVPWPLVVSTRNRLIHGYDSVDFDVLWAVATRDLPELIEHVERALRND